MLPRSAQVVQREESSPAAAVPKCHVTGLTGAHAVWFLSRSWQCPTALNFAHAMVIHGWAKTSSTTRSRSSRVLAPIMTVQCYAPRRRNAPSLPGRDPISLTFAIATLAKHPACMDSKDLLIPVLLSADCRLLLLLQPWWVATNFA
jgi:hypothetical protein